MDNDDQDNHYFTDMDFDLVTPILPPLQDEFICQAVSFDSKANFFEVKNGDKKKSKFYCRVYQFEGRGNIRRGTVFVVDMAFLCAKMCKDIQKRENFFCKVY